MTADETLPGRAPRPRRGGRFPTTVIATVGILAVLAAGLGVASVVRGPRISSGVVNETAAVSKTGQRLTLDVDQRTDAVTPDDVTVTPDAPHSVASDGSSVVITFDGMLRYATDYTVSVALRGSDSGAEATSSYSFTTPDADVYTLVRDYRHDSSDVKMPDSIVQSTVVDPAGSGAAPAAAQRIEEFAASDSMIATVESTADGSDALVLHGTDGAGPYPVFSPDGAIITTLRSAPSAGLFGYTVNGGTADDGSTYRSALLVYDPTASSGRPVVVTSLDGQPLYVVSWVFVPGTSSLVAQAQDQQLYLVDGLTGTSSPIGRHTEIRGFLPGSATLIVGDSTGDSALDLTDGTSTPWTRTPIQAEADEYPGKIVPTGADQYVQQLDRVDYAQSTAPLGSRLVAADPSGIRTVFTPPSAGGRITDFCTSPNGQYLAVEVVSADARVDTYAVTGYENVLTYFVDLATGDSSRSVNGFMPSWCT
ncbi:hypothetical protein ACFJGV_01330 [Cnuibacter sp. UC19_7]|uniref:hypothetical protein n=1 Tax=Cnuibacter sp. UC19_7 TaxID=3350166 RepID=UPI00367246EC